MADLTNFEPETTVAISETTEPSSPEAETPVIEVPEEVAVSNPDEDSSCSPKTSEMPLEEQEQEEQEEEEKKEETEDATEAPDDAGKESEKVVPFEAMDNSEEVRESPATEISSPTADISSPAISAPTDDISAPTTDVSASTTDVSAPTVAVNGHQAVEAQGVAQIEEKTENEKPLEKKEEDSMLPEADSVVVQPHWLPKPCVHVTSIGGSITQEFNMPYQASGWRAY